MNYCKNFTVTILLVLLFLSSGVSAMRRPACEIEVKAVVVNTSKGSSNGEIRLDFGSLSLKTIKIFIADPSSRSVWKEVQDNTVKGLHVGFYDILIVDTASKECAKQLTVEIKSN